MNASPRTMRPTTTALIRAGEILMRITVATAVACLMVGGVRIAGDAGAAIKRTTDIPAQPLAPALQTLMKERDIQLVYRAELIADRRTSGATGELTAIEALGASPRRHGPDVPVPRREDDHVAACAVRRCKARQRATLREHGLKRRTKRRARRRRQRRRRARRLRSRAASGTDFAWLRRMREWMRADDREPRPPTRPAHK